jgi:hypothetical protein
MADESFERLLRRTFARDTPAATCPEPALLAAYADGTLSPGERSGLEAHAAACSGCAAELALLARTADVEPTGAHAAVPRAFRIPWRWAVPLATAGIVFVVWTETEPPDRQAEPQRSPAVSQPAAREEPRGSQDRTAAVAPAPSAAPGDTPRPASPGPAGERKTPAAKPDVDATAERDGFSRLQPRVLEEGAVGGMAAAGQEAPKAAAPPAPAAPEPPASGRAVLPQRARERAQEESAETPATPESAAANAELRSMRKVEDNLAFSDARKDAAAAHAFAVKADASVLVRAGDAGIERSDDAGSTWRLEHEAPRQRVLAGACPSATVCWLAGERGLVLRREPSGRWLERGLAIPASITAIAADDALRATVTTAGGTRLGTSDGGLTWSPRP